MISYLFSVDENAIECYYSLLSQQTTNIYITIFLFPIRDLIKNAIKIAIVVPLLAILFKGNAQHQRCFS